MEDVQVRAEFWLPIQWEGFCVRLPKCMGKSAVLASPRGEAVAKRLMRCSARRRVTPCSNCGLIRRGARLCGGYTSSVRLTAATFPSKGKAVWLAGHTGPPDKNWQIAPYSLPPFEGAGRYEVSSFCNDYNSLLRIRCWTLRPRHSSRWCSCQEHRRRYSEQ